jgi:excisionase family DNA binding protein
MAGYLKIPELARQLDISEQTARRMVKDGRIPSVFVGGAYRVEKGDLRNYLMAARVKVDASPKAEAVSLEEWLENEVGHSYLAMDFLELRHFLEQAEDLDEQLFRRGLLREEIDVVWEERKRSPATQRRNIAGVPFEQLHAKWIQTLFFAVELHIVTSEMASEEANQFVLA